MKSKQNTKSNIAVTPKSKNSQKQKQSRSLKRNAPVAVGVSNRVSKPRFESRGENMVVHHREYIRDITGSTSAFAVADSIEINPGLAASFPWLSQVASRFESHHFRKLNFEFQTESPTSAAGFIAIVPDYNATDAAPSTKSRALQYEDAVKCAPWECAKVVCSQPNLNKRKTNFNRGGAIQADQDLDLYDEGNLFVCVGGQAAATVIGELWADYIVEFSTPQIESTQGPIESVHVAGTTNLTTALPFGDAPTFTFSGETLLSYNSATGAFTALRDLVSILASVRYVGTVITGAGNTSTGTTGTLLAETIISGSTAVSESYKVTLIRGQTFTPSCAATTVTASTMVVAQYSAT